MKPLPDRIQGTDGIRGPVHLASEFPGRGPLEVFLEQGVLTEEFFELYAYATCQMVLEAGWANPGEEVILGWDTRDASGVFNQAAVRGVRKSGLHAVVVGIQPTPAVALYLVKRQAALALMLTASHNPSHQNGIKVFLGGDALKLFPEDDRRLTRHLGETPWTLLQQLEPEGMLREAEDSAREAFAAFCRDFRNSWLPQLPQQLVLVADAANGAYAPVLSSLLEGLPHRVVNANLEGINARSGVADLEGLQEVRPEEVESGRFQGYEALEVLLDEGRSCKYHRKETLALGLVFDGDGDRCFLMYYDPEADTIRINTGDSCALLMAQHMTGKRFVNTVESDLEALRAARARGWKATQCAVGDKWILWQALRNEWEQRAALLEDAVPEVDALLKAMDAMETDSRHDALHLSLLVRQARARLADEELDYPDFGLGYEESGHVITPGWLQDDSGTERVVYVGNGLKTGLNLLASLDWSSVLATLDSLKTPYENGHQRSRPVYYVKSEALLPGHPVRQRLLQEMKTVLQATWPEAEQKELFLPEEPTMLAIGVWSHQSIEALLFIRNSGTEDKATLYIRGQRSHQERLEQVEEQLFRSLLRDLKDDSKPQGRAELEVLRNIRAGDPIQVEERVSLEHLLHEMHARQSLICRVDQQWALTPWGELRLAFSERSE